MPNRLICMLLQPQHADDHDFLLHKRARQLVLAEHTW